MKKLFLCLFALALAFCFFGCEDKTPVDASKIAKINDEAVYDAILGEFYTVYAEAVKEQNVAKRYALMAIAEAKLMEAGVMMPLQANGGNAAIGNVAPYSVDYSLWGNDYERYHGAIVCTTAIKASDRNALKAQWAQLKGTGTYHASAISYLEDHGYTVKDTYSIGYTSEPETFDAFVTSQAADSEVLINTYDGLAEYDCEGTLQPALATSWDMSADGLTYTFHIRSGVNWVNRTGEVIATVTADDWCAGFQHMLDDPEGGLSWLVDGLVVGVSDYLGGKTTDFNDVGVKAVDDSTLEFHLEHECSFFLTMLGYSIFAPLNRAYFLSQGGVFGFGAYAEAKDFTYGSSPDNILYCGPYLIKAHTENNSWEFEKNENYWNAANVQISTLKWVYNDGSVATQAYDDWTNGVIDSCGLNSAALAKCKQDGKYEDYGYISSTGSSSYPGFFNVYRRGFANSNDATKVVSQMTQVQADECNVAMQLKNFRLALAFAFDRTAYLGASVGSELATNAMVNSYTPGTFVKLPEAVTVKINGQDQTFAANTWYGEIMQAQATADGFEAVLFDKNADGGAGSSGGYDGWLQPATAQAYLAKAVAELAEKGIEVSAKHPIVIEYPYQADGSTKTAMAQVVKSSIETNLNGLVKVNLIDTGDRAALLYACYYNKTGATANYTLSTTSGWGPDYGDPSSYLDTMVKGGGYMTKCLGLDV